MYDKLKGIMREYNFTQEDMSKYLQMSIATFNLKLNGASDFSIREGKKLSNLFNKPLDEIFITHEITKMEIKK